MGKVLEALGRAEASQDEWTRASLAEEDFALPEDGAEVPYIEVGPARSLDASPIVLALRPVPRFRVAPEDAAPVLAPLGDGAPEPASLRPVGYPAPVFEPLAPASSTETAAVCFRPLVADAPAPVRRFLPDVIAYRDPDHPISAQYRQLAASLRRDARPGMGRLALFTTLSPDADAVAVVLNLAVSLARQGEGRVAVVDARRRPAVAERLGLREGPGLAEVLAGEQSLDGALQGTPVENLTALTAGEEMLARSLRAPGETIRPVLRQLRDRFDVVLIDASGGAASEEALPLETACDDVYVVASAAEADAPGADERVRAMARQGSPVRGCIVTTE